MDNKNWRFCAVGNIKEQHTDENGNVLYGTIAFTGGTKVYIYDLCWGLNKGETTVIGLNRFKRYAVENVPINLIENVRFQRIFKPKVLEIMDYMESMDGYAWRGRTSADRKALEAFVEKWS